ncbi:acetyl/propionyl/methylcrotonyl-CoA carboxylase subunit alpha [Pseudohongiella spirulinae]|uniref:3-methylcrotonyl-CoA carboxylase subunit alpha n=1 Tax=Pseudohongiella spirulinae TaxID=1249552 RepID=A0A0S2KEQ9_9GAMM|nr:biotin carboxylase N-terminal domain-containing protein [Pseudohongiella spirulinae]ALO46447.1 3-methylcrotonyl-CoA carboxylase subunit alpha [Pseudohongiella spirulinae]
MIKSLLIANRGEIACRIIRTAHRLGVRTVPVWSEVDRGALHVALGTEAVYVPRSVSACRQTTRRGEGSSGTPSLTFPPPGSLPGTKANAGDVDRLRPQNPYLDLGYLIETALAEDAEAIHPGYGFLSENAEFAQAVVDAGLIFVGPPASAIAAMGSKSQAKRLMTEAGVPLLPGYHGDDQSADTLLAEANKIGYPVLIKAVSGGGGRGMRIVEDAAQFSEALAAVKREAKAAFNDDKVLIEKYLARARHVEVQIFADNHGNCLHLHERDCSIQRRHQKLIEEAPAPGLKTATRLAMGEAAVRAAQAIGYSGAGTVEFLYQDDAFYFLEMNTRLQVEHPVTEMITGLDLVEWQLRVASGEPLPVTQDEIQRDGWSIEARINAESGAPDFLPSIGLIESLRWPRGENIRVDAGFRAGDRISMNYDSMIGKVIAHGSSRAEAVARLSEALSQLQINGIENNADYLGAILDTDAFRQGEVQTGFIMDHQAAIAAELVRRNSARMTSSATGAASAIKSANDWGHLSAWRSVSNAYSVQHHLRPLFGDGNPSAACDPVTLTGDTHAGDHHKQTRAPLPGRIISVQVSPGDTVKAGQALLIMEAMKMEHTLRAAADAVIDSVLCAEGDMVQPDQILMEFTD